MVSWNILIFSLMGFKRIIFRNVFQRALKGHIGLGIIASSIPLWSLLITL